MVSCLESGSPSTPGIGGSSEETQAWRSAVGSGNCGATTSLFEGAQLVSNISGNALVSRVRHNFRPILDMDDDPLIGLVDFGGFFGALIGNSIYDDDGVFLAQNFIRGCLGMYLLAFDLAPVELVLAEPPEA